MQSFHFAPREGSLVKVLFGVCALAAFAGVSLAYPQYTYESMAFFVIGVMVTWREYLRWRRAEHRRRQCER